MVAGIDVSHHQFVVNWTEVAATEIRFCFIKATEGVSNPDPRFPQNWAAVGSLTPGDLPPVLDLEAVESRSGVTPFFYLSPSTHCSVTLACMDLLAIFKRGNYGGNYAAGGPESI